MNASELADKLEKPMLDNPDCPNFSRTRGFMEQVVAMLRQQQAEIEALKLSLSGQSAEILSKNDETLPNGKCEPVAWMYERPNGSAKLTFVREPMAGTVVTETPLYTHPVEITDEEIEEVEKSCKKPLASLAWQVEFARAILRKARE